MQGGIDMKYVFIFLAAIGSSTAFAGGGGGLHFDDKVREVKKIECRSSSARLTFSDITWYDDEEGYFDSTNLVIERPGANPLRYFVWASSMFVDIPSGTPSLTLKKVAMVDKTFLNKETYFNIDIDFATGKGFLSGARYDSVAKKVAEPYMTMTLNDCAWAR
jgi:hypothetical protein